MTRTQKPNLRRKLRLAGMLIITGLVAQLCSLFWNHPLSFLVFVFIGSVASMVGIVLYLLAIVSLPDQNLNEKGARSAEAP